jgi:hypothetical protein
MARIGRYGNVDDQGVRFAWIRTIAVSDTAVYAADPGNRRILKAALGYHEEETVPVPPFVSFDGRDIYAEAIGRIDRNDAEGLRMLIREVPAVVSEKDDEGMPLLNRACMTGSVDCVALLLDSGANIEARDRFERTPLHCAAGWSSLRMVKYLASRGADTRAITKTKATPLEFARHNYFKSMTIEQKQIISFLNPTRPSRPSKKPSTGRRQRAGR